MPKTGEFTTGEDTAENADEQAADPAPASSRRAAGAAVLVRLGVVVVVLGLAGGGIWFATKASTPDASPTTTDIPALQVKAADVQPGSVVPASVTVAGGADQETLPQAQTHVKGGRSPLQDWADQVGRVTGIPPRAALAYGNAELALRQVQPSCKISWATLAGIGRIESNHGQYGGAVLGADGRPSKPIVGVPLDGSGGVRAIGDTDGGRIDGDPGTDRAVGPMQFIPGTWRKWASDGNGDGLGDPQQIDDAALAAARYLCASGRDMGTAAGWWAGILSYNNSTDYAQKVFGLADGYAKAARVIRVQS